MVRLCSNVRLTGVQRETARILGFARACSKGDFAEAHEFAIQSTDPDRVRLMGVIWIAKQDDCARLPGVAWARDDRAIPLSQALERLDFGHLRYHPLYRRALRCLEKHRPLLAKKYEIPGAFGTPRRAPARA